MFWFSPVRRVFTRSAFTLLVVSFLSAAFLFTGCKTESNDEYVDNHVLNKELIGTWLSTYTDGYIITAKEISYDMGGGTILYAGTIEYVSNFSDTAGVIIMKYKPGQEQSYFTADHWSGCTETQPCSHNIPRPGDYVGIYYENFNPGDSVDIGTAVKLSDYTGAETTTMYQAAVKFTKEKKTDFVGLMGTYIKN